MGRHLFLVRVVGCVVLVPAALSLDACSSSRTDARSGASDRAGVDGSAPGAMPSSDGGAVPNDPPPLGGGAPVTGPAAARSAIESAIGEVCRRLLGECRAECDTILSSCPESQAACVEDYSFGYLSGTTNPVTDPALANACRAQLSTAPCSGLSGDSWECRYAVVEMCPTDDAAAVDAYFWSRAPRVSVGEARSLVFCDDVERWLSLSLEAGQSVVIEWEVPPPNDDSANLTIFSKTTNALGRTELVELADVHSWDWPFVFGPANATGDYLLSFEGFVDQNFRATVRLSPPTGDPPRE